MREDPIALERRVLLDFALAFARRTSEKPRLSAALSRTMRLLARRALDYCGEDAWPLRPLLSWRYQRIRRSIRRQRGLPS